MTRTATQKVFPKDIKHGQQIRVPFATWSGRRRFEWRTVALVEKQPGSHGYYELTLLGADGMWTGDRVCVNANSKHEVRG